jgi:uncharacterized protein (TIGR00266 family)
MDIEVLHRPGAAAARVRLGAGEVCTAEGGAMIAMSGDMQIETTTKAKGKGGILAAAKRMLGGESFFLNHFTAGDGGGELWVGTPLVGDMMQYELRGENLIVQGGSFVACEQDVNIDVGWQGFKTLFSGEKLFWLHLNGTGKVVINSFGAIYPIEVDGEYIVDTGHIVAFNETLNFTVTKAGKSWLSSFLGGEGLVCKFSGTGTVWCQSHNTSSFGEALGPYLKGR